MEIDAELNKGTPIYLCDCEKNVNCPKDICHEKCGEEMCKATSYIEYAKRDENGEPIVIGYSTAIRQKEETPHERSAG